MKNRLLLLAVMALASLTLSGCATLFSDVAVSQAMQQGKVHVGMTLDELVAIVGHQPNNIQDRVQSRTDASGETLEWIPSAKEGTLMNSYLFTFQNRRLVSWQKK